MTTSDVVVVGASGRAGPDWSTMAWAVAEAMVSDRRLLVCHVCPPDSPLARYSGRVPMNALELARPSLTRAVNAACGALGGDRVEVTVRSGHPGRELVSVSDRAGLLVVGPPEADWMVRPSASHYVTRHARVPVVIARATVDGADHPFAGHVVVGVDGSPASRAAVQFALVWADAHRRPVAAVYVSDADREDVWFDEQLLESHFTVEPPGLALVGAELDRIRFDLPPVPVKRALFAGQPVDGLRRAAAGARLLVVGDRGQGAGLRLLLGSVAHALVDRAECAVAVVHATGRVVEPVPAMAAAMSGSR